MRTTAHTHSLWRRSSIICSVVVRQWQTVCRIEIISQHRKYWSKQLTCALGAGNYSPECTTISNNNPSKSIRNTQKVYETFARNTRTTDDSFSMSNAYVQRIILRPVGSAGNGTQTIESGDNSSTQHVIYCQAKCKISFSFRSSLSQKRQVQWIAGKELCSLDYIKGETRVKSVSLNSEQKGAMFSGIACTSTAPKLTSIIISIKILLHRDVVINLNRFIILSSGSLCFKQISFLCHSILSLWLMSMHTASLWLMTYQRNRA